MLSLLKSGIFEQKPQDSKKEIIFVPLCREPETNSKNSVLEKTKNQIISQNWTRHWEAGDKLKGQHVFWQQNILDQNWSKFDKRHGRRGTN